MSKEEFVNFYLNAKPDIKILVEKVLCVEKEKRSELSELIKANKDKDLIKVLKEYFHIEG